MGHPPKLKTWNSSRRKGSGSWSRGKGNDGFRSEACFVCMTGNIIRRIDRTRSQLRNVACVTGFPVVLSAPLKPKAGLNGPPASLKPNSGLSATHPPAQDAGRVGQPRERLRKVWESLPVKPESGLNGTPALTQAKLGIVGHPPSRTRRGKGGA